MRANLKQTLMAGVVLAAIALAFIVIFVAVTGSRSGIQQSKKDAVRMICEHGELMRIEVNKRGAILKNFLNSAARVREQTAAVQKGVEARLNRDVAVRWRADARSVHDLLKQDCVVLVRTMSK